MNDVYLGQQMMEDPEYFRDRDEDPEDEDAE